jgi:hypothetical protein
VPWQDLAAIEFIETRFGRVRGLSPAGAQGPMQFMAATWARYGSGEIGNQRDAILAAARHLATNGAPRDMAGALYHYNPSRGYVRAVQDYASRMRADVRAYYVYSYWQVLYARQGGTIISPSGTPDADRYRWRSQASGRAERLALRRCESRRSLGAAHVGEHVLTGALPSLTRGVKRWTL